MRAYPAELRERVVAAIDQGEGTRAVTAARFRVSVAFVGKLLRQRRETGSIELRRAWTGSRPAVDERAVERLRKAVAQRPDAILLRADGGVLQRRPVVDLRRTSRRPGEGAGFTDWPAAIRLGSLRVRPRT